MTRTALDAVAPGGGRASLRCRRHERRTRSAIPRASRRRFLGGRRHGRRNVAGAAGRGAELLCGGGWAARRAAVKRSGTGGAGTAARLAVGRGSGRRMRVITSLTSCWRKPHSAPTSRQRDGAVFAPRTWWPPLRRQRATWFYVEALELSRAMQPIKLINIF